MKRRFRWCAALSVLIIVTGIALTAVRQHTVKVDRPIAFDVPYAALQRALEADIASQHQAVPINWVDLLACLAANCHGDFSRYRDSDLDALVSALQAGSGLDRLTESSSDFAYYRKIYGTVLDGLVGFKEDTTHDNSTAPSSYGLKAYFPLAADVSYEHYDDFGDERTYGYVRPHLGHDLLCAAGTPVIAIEEGLIEAIGWNRYGGWRIGIRSLDGQRYYYYAHLQQDHPYHVRCRQGTLIHAGEVIGYVGRTGYSDIENVSNISVPHLHIGLELIFDEQERAAGHEIWVDLYPLITLLAQHQTEVHWNSTCHEFDSSLSFLSG